MTPPRRTEKVVTADPDVRKRRKPAGAVVLIVAFIAFDAARLHLLHHLLGADSGLVAMVLILLAVVWGLVRTKQKKAGRGDLGSRVRS